MTKKEKLEYFKLVEPKLREKYLNRTLKESDYEALNIKGKDVELFKETYESYWIDEDFHLNFVKDEEFWSDIDVDDNGDDILKLDFPDDKYFYQFGIKNLNIERFKYELERKTRVLFINRITGGIESKVSFILDEDFELKNDKKHIKLVIDNPFTFLEQIKNGEIDKILSNEKKHSFDWEIPKAHPLTKAIDPFPMDDFIDILSDNKQWINFRFFNEMFFSFDDLSSLKFANIGIFNTYYEEKDGKLEMNLFKDVDTRPMNDFFFKVENPQKMRFELMNGNMEIMNEIKEINFCHIFDPRENEA